MIKNIQFIFYLLSTTFIVINTLDNVFMESIKSKYSYIPGKFSNFGKVINFLKMSIIIIAIILMPFYWGLVFTGKLNPSNSENGSSNIIISIFTIIFIILFALNLFLTPWYYSKVKIMFINTLEGKKNDKLNSFKISFFGIEIQFKQGKKDYTYKMVNFNTTISYINLAIYIIFITGIVLVTKGNVFKEAETLATFSYFLIIGLMMSIVNSSVKKALEEIKANKEYIFIYGEDNSIVTKLYLDFKEEYLLMKEGYEIFIPKNTIKRKVVRYIK
ncbi:hypothetical protein DDA98_04180 [Clostridium perfringens]|uniref:hypothetical protein n=1 Tax=Clostridium perfringens TaxID=1502 RepID=UPI000D51BF77|nr:hypothetical protein [Clostridium perfringens]PVE17053.1 hypothetical protein DDA98_04180 [Clostridium perfringens]